jgi:hypothetical protein
MTKVCITVSGLFLGAEIIFVILYCMAVLNAHLPRTMNEPLMFEQGVTKRCRLPWLTNSALDYEPKCGEREGVAGSPPMSTAVHRRPNKPSEI